MTYKSVQDQLRASGIVMSKKGNVLRINYFSGLEDTALYTASLQEALEKGLAMAKPQLRNNIGLSGSPMLRTRAA